MTGRFCIAFSCLLGLAMATAAEEAEAQQAYGQQWSHSHNTRDWDRFYHYPYVYYPQNYWSQDYYSSSESMYHRYPPEMRIPVYNKKWHNYYPAGRSYNNGRNLQRQSGQRYHSGHHFVLDVF